jgi:hypothetical protein
MCRHIHIISTKHESAEMIAQNESHLNPTFMPRCVVDYNKGIVSVDHHDQVLASFPIMRKFLKGYQKIFSLICDTALLNSHILHNKNTISKK